MKREDVWEHGQHRHLWLQVVPVTMYAREELNHFPPEPELDQPPEFFQELVLLDQRDPP